MQAYRTGRQFPLSQLFVATAIVAMVLSGLLYFPSAGSVLLWSAALLVWCGWGPRRLLGVFAYVIVFGTLALALGAMIVLVVAGHLLLGGL
jgi:hypothetical protein